MMLDAPSPPSLIERERRTESVFRPPTFAKASPPPKKTLTATARPWYPTAAVVTETRSITLPRPILAPPAALGLSPDAGPHLAPVLSPLPFMSSPQSPESVVFSPLSNPVNTCFHSFTDVATDAKVYPVDMFMSVRKDASHTPHGVLRWCVRQYIDVPSLKVPTHLQLSMNEVLHAEDGVIRGALGSGLKGKVRAKPVRMVHHKVMSVLSRITPQKYTDLLHELLQLPLRQADETELHEIVRVFFDKAVQEPEYSELYARLFSELCVLRESERELEEKLKDRLFCTRISRELLRTCDEEFHRPIALTADEKVDRTTGKPFSEEEVEMKRMRLKNRLIGNIKFVGELFKIALVTESVIVSIFELLVGSFDPSNPVEREDYVFEVFAMLIKTVGPNLKEHHPTVLSHYLGVVKSVEAFHPRPRIRFLMMDMRDLSKKQGWVTTARTVPKADSCEDMRRSASMKHVDSVTSTSYLQSSLMSPGEDAITQRSDYGLPRPASVTFRDSAGLSSCVLVNPPSPNNSTVLSRFSAQSKAAPAPAGSYLRPAFAAASQPTSVGPRSPPTSGSSRPASDLNASRSIIDFAMSGTSRSRTSTAPATEVVNIQDVSQQLMQNFSDPKEETTVLRGMEGMSLKNKVLCLTWWLRQVSTDTSRFDDRQRVTKLLSSLLSSCPSFHPNDLMSAIIEWLRFDIEKLEYRQCPRMFENIGHMIQHCYAPDVAALPNVTEVRSLLHLGLFNVMLHDLTASNGADQMVTLLKSANTISTALLNTIVDPPTDTAALRVTLQCRVRLLPYFLSVSNISENGIPGTPPRCRTPTSPNPRNSPLAESASSVGHYDPLSQCMAFHKIADEVEFVVLRHTRTDGGERARAWKEAVVSLAVTDAGNGSTVSQLVQVAKVIGALLACSTVPMNGSSLLTPAEVDEVVGEILKRRPGPLFQAVAAMEVIMHHTLSVAGVNPRKSIRVKQLRLMYARWCTQNILDKSVVMDLLHRMHEAENGTGVYAAYHNALADHELPWSSVLAYLS